MTSFLEKILDNTSRDPGVFFEDVVFGSFKKHCVDNRSPMFNFVCNGETFTVEDSKEVLKFLKSVGLDVFSTSKFLSTPHEEVYLEEKNCLLLNVDDLNENPATIGFFTFHSRFKEKEKVSIISCKFSSTNEEVVDKIQEFFKAKKKPAEIKKGSIYMLCQAQSGLETRFLGVDFVPLERGNYSPEVLKGYDHVISEFNKTEPNGCIFIASSPAGCGKTFSVRSMLGEIQNSIFVYVPPSMIRDLAGPSLVTCLIDLAEGNEKKNIILVLEDADEVLAPRMSDNMSSISTILNLTDGILGKILNIRIIATTNTSDKKFDQALLRPGRLCANLKFGALSKEQGEKIYQRLTGNTIELKKDHTLAEIYGLASNNGAEPENKQIDNKTGF